MRLSVSVLSLSKKNEKSVKVQRRTSMRKCGEARIQKVFFMERIDEE